jgi:hypothetical protein
MNGNLFNDLIYLKSEDNKYRYALGTKGEKTLYCFGINPSTATPEKYDPTITRVKNIAHKSGADSFVMFNIYPLKATDPSDLPDSVNWNEHLINVDAILHLIKDGAVVWAAWGDLINTRSWLKECQAHIFHNLKIFRKNIRWVNYLKHQDFSEYVL